MKTRNLLVASIISASVLMTGCAGSNTKQENAISDPIVKQDKANDPIETIKRISIEARDELRLLAKAEQAQAQQSMTLEQHQQKAFQALHVPQGFDKMVTIKYTGPVEEVAKLVAEAAGYEFRTYGKRPGIAMFINIDLDNQPLNDALKELGVQTGDSAMIEVYEKGKVIVLNYAPKQ